MPLWQCGSLAFWHCYYRFLLTLGSCKTRILRLDDDETCKWTCDWPWPWRNVCRACVMQPVCHTKGTVLLVCMPYAHHTYAKGEPKVTMFAVEMWFGVGDGVECGRSTGLCPLPLGVPRCVIHNIKNVGTKFLVILKILLSGKTFMSK